MNGVYGVECIKHKGEAGELKAYRKMARLSIYDAELGESRYETYGMAVTCQETPGGKFSAWLFWADTFEWHRVKDTKGERLKLPTWAKARGYCHQLPRVIMNAQQFPEDRQWYGMERTPTPISELPLMVRLACLAAPESMEVVAA